MTSERNSIRNAFLEGMQEIYSVMFSTKLKLYMMDTSGTHLNIYQESTDKRYLTPKTLIGRIELFPEQGELPVESIKNRVKITVPTNELIQKKVPHKPEDLEYLRKSVFEYENVNYTVERVKPSNNIVDEYLVYIFDCKEEEKNSLGGSIWE